MRIVIAGGHGKIALILERMLVQRGDSVAGFIRNPAHAADLEAAGAEPLVVDLEHVAVDEVAAHLRGADAVVFAAGAGPGSGAARKDTVDRDAAILLADAAEAAGVRRFLVVSSTGADAHAPDGDDPIFTTYLRAKGAADDSVRARAALDWTIVRPGHLTDDPGSGMVEIADETLHGTVPRADVATVLLALLDTPDTADQTIEVIGGEAPIGEALAARARRSGI